MRKGANKGYNIREAVQITENRLKELHTTLTNYATKNRTDKFEFEQKIL